VKKTVANKWIGGLWYHKKVDGFLSKIISVLLCSLKRKEIKVEINKTEK
jgi:hypothetical protein